MSDNDPDDNDLEVLAGEYVLGVLSLDERYAVSARRLVEPQLDAAILRWENRLDPLLDYIGAVPPPPDLWPRIMRELAESPVAHDLVENLQRRARRWKITALTAGALAASLALGLGLSEMGRLATPQNFVAVLQKDAASPAFVVSVDLSTRELTIRPLDAVAPAGKSYELWIINEKLGPPKSLGVVEKADFTSNDKLRAYPPEVVKSSLYAITVEQTGGSPDGKPSGAPVFAGKLIRAVP
jgi:anti-sigma-K factor RskA